MTKNVKSIPDTRIRFGRLSVALTATICTVSLFGIMMVGLALKPRPLPGLPAEPTTSVESKLQQAKSVGGVRTARLNEDEVNSLIRDRLQKFARAMRTDAPGIRDLRVHLMEDRIRAFIVLGYSGAQVTVDIEGKLYSSHGFVQFVPVAGEIGSLPIPQTALVDALQQVMNKPEVQRRLRLPRDVSELRVENNQVLLRYE